LIESAQGSPTQSLAILKLAYCQHVASATLWQHFHYTEYLLSDFLVLSEVLRLNPQWTI